MNPEINYRKFVVSPTVTVVFFDKEDLRSRDKRKQYSIECELLARSDRRIIQGCTFIQRNGYSRFTKGLKWDKEKEKVFIIIDETILKRYETPCVHDGVTYYF